MPGTSGTVSAATLGTSGTLSTAIPGTSGIEKSLLDNAFVFKEFESWILLTLLNTFSTVSTGTWADTTSISELLTGTIPSAVIKYS